MWTITFGLIRWCEGVGFELSASFFVNAKVALNQIALVISGSVIPPELANEYLSDEHSPRVCFF